MKAVKIVAIAALVYVGIVAAFESAIGFFQPADASTLVITTFDAAGDPHDRVVSRLAVDDRLYVAANHWPRAWYDRLLDHPEVRVSLDGETGSYQAVPIAGAEHDRVEREHELGLVFRILTGFPPRRLVRLDPSPLAG